MDNWYKGIVQFMEYNVHESTMWSVLQMLIVIVRRKKEKRKQRKRKSYYLYNIVLGARGGQDRKT